MEIDEQKLAQELLVSRTEEPSILRPFKKNLKRYVRLGLLIIIVIFVSKKMLDPDSQELNSYFIFLVGMSVGAVVRDIGWFKRIKELSSFNKKIVDWRKVEELAKENDFLKL